MKFTPTAVCQEHPDYRGRRQPQGPRTKCQPCVNVHRERKAFEDLQTARWLRRFRSDVGDPSVPPKLWVIYDERAVTQGTDDAAVLESCASLREVKTSDWDGTHGPLGAVYEYDVVPRDGANCLENETFIGTVTQIQ